VSNSASLPSLRFSLRLDANEPLVTHNVAAMVEIERAAFFAARSRRAEMSQRRTGA